jgi:hypothetical protein
VFAHLPPSHVLVPQKAHGRCQHVDDRHTGLRLAAPLLQVGSHGGSISLYSLVPQEQEHPERSAPGPQIA